MTIKQKTSSLLTVLAAIPLLISPIEPSQAGMVAFFDKVEGKCPQGWREFTDGKGRLIMGTKPIGLAARHGTPLANKTPPSHTHSIAISHQLSSKKVVAAKKLWPFTANTGVASSDATNTASSTSTAENGALPMIQMLLCEEAGSTNIAADMRSEMVAFFFAKSCPKDWQFYEKLDGRYVLPLPANAGTGDVGKTVGNGAAPNARALNIDNHSHALSINAAGDKTSADATLQVQEIGMEAAKEGLFVKEDYGWAIRTTAASSSSIGKSGGGYPVIALLPCQKTKGRGNLDKLPQDMLAFMSAQQCPRGWREKAGTHGRFLVGLPAGQHAKSGTTFGGPPMNNLEVRTHQHSFSASMALANQPFIGFTGNTNSGFAKSGTYTISGNLQSNHVELPYVQLRHCIVPTRDSGRSSGGIRQ